MQGLEISVVYDLNLSVSSKFKELREELLARLQKEDMSYYGFDYYGGARVSPIMGNLVRVDFTRHGTTRTEALIAFDGMPARRAEIKESGSDHFPAAGLYEASTLPKSGISGASARVNWDLNHDYALSNDVIETVERNHTLGVDFTEAIRLEVPVVCSRSWRLTLTAPKLKRALAAYELLRSGEWKPKTTFIDTLSDKRKLHSLGQTVEAE